MTSFELVLSEYLSFKHSQNNFIGITKKELQLLCNAFNENYTKNLFNENYQKYYNFQIPALNNVEIVDKV